MDQEKKDQGVIAVLLKRFENERYPRAQLIKTKVDNGAVLDDQDIAFIEQTLEDAHQEMAIILRHPEYASLAKEVMLMYEEIMSTSQKNSSEA
ncbi:MAG: hypothetical protein QNK36_10130 [Colwellia sp.]|nr:hypothetical protein [Colwellia sp.]